MDHPVIFQNPELEGKSFYWPNGDVAILCLHGFTATTVEVRGIAEFFRGKGYTTCGPLFPGHGTSPEELNQTHWQDWVASAESSYLMLKQKHSKVFVLGESMGGLAALHLAVKYSDISGIILLAPALNIPRLWTSKLLGLFKEYVYKPYVKKKADNASPWQGYNVIPLKAASSFYDFQRVIKRELNKVMLPLIIFQGKKDKTIDPMSSVCILQGVSSNQKELVWLERSGHVVLLDQQIHDVETLCGEFLTSILDRTDDR